MPTCPDAPYDFIRQGESGAIEPGAIVVATIAGFNSFRKSGSEGVIRNIRTERVEAVRENISLRSCCID